MATMTSPVAESVIAIFFNMTHPPRAHQALSQSRINSASKTTPIGQARIGRFRSPREWQGLAASSVAAYARCQSDPDHRRHHFPAASNALPAGLRPGNNAVRAQLKFSLTLTLGSHRIKRANAKKKQTTRLPIGELTKPELF
jgi:hypothetical protein